MRMTIGLLALLLSTAAVAQTKPTIPQSGHNDQGLPVATLRDLAGVFSLYADYSGLQAEIARAQAAESLKCAVDASACTVTPTGGANAALSALLSGTAPLPNLTIGGTLSLTSPSRSIVDVHGTLQSLFGNFPAYGWEYAAGTDAAPITTPGPSLKVSRTESLPVSACPNSAGVGVFNDNSCNAAIYAAAANSQPYAAQDGMQLTGVLGTALTYSLLDTGEAVGVQGIARGVGATMAGVAGGYFEGRMDSTAVRNYEYLVGVEARVNNISTRDATMDLSGGNSMNAYLASCGGGAYQAWKCNSGLQVISNFQPFLNGVVITAGAATTNGFYDNSNSVNAFVVRGTHTYQINGMNWYVTGDGHTVIGPSSNPLAAPNMLTVGAASANLAYFGSTGPNSALVSIDDNAGGQQAGILLQDGAATKWQVIKDASNAFVIYDQATTTAVVKAVSGGQMTLGTPGKVVQMQGPVGLPRYTVATLPTCATVPYSMAVVTDALSPTYNGAVTGGGAKIVPVFCDGTSWTAH